MNAGQRRFMVRYVLFCGALTLAIWLSTGSAMNAKVVAPFIGLGGAVMLRALA